MTEYIVYQAYDYEVLPLPEKDSGAGLSLSKFTSRLSLSLFLAGMALLLITYTPSFLVWAKNAIGDTTANFSLSKREITYLKATSTDQKPEYQPPFDPSLPVINHLVIPSIGVDTDIEEATYDNYETALKKGVWRVSDFGAPGENGMPVILAAHRYGYLAWTNFYRRENSFFNLPKLKIGDTVQVVWRQRKYTYEIYKESKGKDIMDYTADLVLYTCESLTGEERVFKYARLIEI